MDTFDKQIRSLKDQIKATKQAIKDLEVQIKQYEGLIARDGAGYDVDSLIASNVHSNEQIDRMMQHISKAQTQIADNKKMQEFVKEKEGRVTEVVIDANRIEDFV